METFYEQLLNHVYGCACSATAAAAAAAAMSSTVNDKLYASSVQMLHHVLAYSVYAAQIYNVRTIKECYRLDQAQTMREDVLVQVRKCVRPSVRKNLMNKMWLTISKATKQFQPSQLGS